MRDKNKPGQSGSPDCPVVSVLLACHDRKALTLAALEGVMAQRLPASVILDILLVDDGSTDGTGEAVAGRFPQVRRLRGDGTLFWNGAMTLAQQAAMGEEIAFHLWLNDDVVLYPDALEHLLALHDGEVAAGRRAPIIVGSMVDPATGRPSYGGHFRRPGIHPFRFGRVFADGEAPIACDTFNGNCLLVPASVFRILGPIDPIFSGGQSLGDTDYGLRAAEAGIPRLVAPRAVGTCAPNLTSYPWREKGRSLGQRLRALTGPLGPVRHQTVAFYRRHGGFGWWLWWGIHGLRCLLAALRPLPLVSRQGLPRLAMIEPVLPWYRLPLLTRMLGNGRVDVTVFHGTAHPDGEPDRDPPPGVGHRRTRNIYWPWGGDRILWSQHVWSVLFGKYDVVMMAEHVYTASNWLIWLWSRLRGRPRILLTGHFRLDRDPDGWLAPLRRAWVRGADYLAPYTGSGAEHCRAVGIADCRMTVLRNTLDVEEIRKCAAGARPLTDSERRSLVGEAGEAVFLFIGRLYPDKRAPLAAEAVGALSRGGYPARLVVVGEGHDRGGLEHLERSGCPLRLLGERRDPEDLARLFALARAVLIPDAAGLAVVHAFAHGRPVILGPGFHHRVEAEYVRHGENGLIAEAMTPAALAAQMRRLLEEPGLAERLCLGAIATADGLGMEGYVRRLEALVERAAHD
ncbi:MAG: glycosyltransferase [Alphaproteobacteria bacterium]